MWDMLTFSLPLNLFNVSKLIQHLPRHCIDFLEHILCNVKNSGIIWTDIHVFQLEIHHMMSVKIRGNQFVGNLVMTNHSRFPVSADQSKSLKNCQKKAKNHKFHPRWATSCLFWRITL